MKPVHRKYWTIAVVMFALLALIWSGCNRDRLPSGAEDTDSTPPRMRIASRRNKSSVLPKDLFLRLASPPFPLPARSGLLTSDLALGSGLHLSFGALEVANCWRQRGCYRVEMVRRHLAPTSPTS